MENGLELTPSERIWLQNLTDLINHGASLLHRSPILLSSLGLKETYLYLLFGAVNNYAEAIHTLCKDFRPEATINLLRSIVEAYINYGYLLAHPSDNRLKYSLLEDSLARKNIINEAISLYNKYAKLRPVDHSFSEKNLVKLRKIPEKEIEGFVEMGINITSKKQLKKISNYTTDLMQRARINDRRFKTGHYEYYYVMVYRYFSDYSHLSMRGLNNFLTKDKSGYSFFASQSANNIEMILITTYRLYLFFLNKIHQRKIIKVPLLTKFNAPIKKLSKKQLTRPKTHDLKNQETK